MKIVSLLKPGLLIYEVFRLVILTIILILQANNSSVFVMMIFATPGVLFPIMALFICLNTAHYREYLPLFIAGKSIGIFALLSWFIISQQLSMVSIFLSGITLLSFDLFSLASVLVIKNDVDKSTSGESQTINPAIANNLNESGNLPNNESNMEEN